MALQAREQTAAGRVEDGEETVVAADDERPPARHVRHATDRRVRNRAEPRALLQRLGVDQRDGPVALPDGEDLAVGAQGIGEVVVPRGVVRNGTQRVTVAGRSRVERAAEAAVAGEVPDQDRAVLGGACRASRRRG